MSTNDRLLKDHLEELEVYVTRISADTGIPAAHLEKDFWVTEVLRGAAEASHSTGCSLIFKGGTSLSKAHRIIERFSEDVDLIVVLPEGGAKSHNNLLKSFVTEAEATTRIDSSVDPATTTKGVKRTATFMYPTARPSGFLKPGVLMEVGTRGGALPHRRLPVQSLIAEYAESSDLPVDFVEADPVSILVLEPVRTLVEKLMLLHHAASHGDDQRIASTARHYYDVDRLLQNPAVRSQLADLQVDVLARETANHSTAGGLPSADRPKGGFAASAAWSSPSRAAADAYEQVRTELIWPGSPASTFAECCARVQDAATLL